MSSTASISLLSSFSANSSTSTGDKGRFSLAIQRKAYITGMIARKERTKNKSTVPPTTPTEFTKLSNGLGKHCT